MKLMHSMIQGQLKGQKVKRILLSRTIHHKNNRKRSYQGWSRVKWKREQKHSIWEKEKRKKLIFRIEEPKKCLSLFNQFHYIAVHYSFIDEDPLIPYKNNGIWHLKRNWLRFHVQILVYRRWPLCPTELFLSSVCFPIQLDFCFLKIYILNLF